MNTTTITREFKSSQLRWCLLITDLFMSNGWNVVKSSAETIVAESSKGGRLDDHFAVVSISQLPTRSTTKIILSVSSLDPIQKQECEKLCRELIAYFDKASSASEVEQAC